MTTLLLVGAAAAAGAVARYLLDRAVQTRHGRPFPWGTWVVNVSGSLLLGLLAGLAGPGLLLTVTGVGFLGAYTTFSTFAVETLRLAEDGAAWAAAANVVGSVVAGLAAAAAGLALGYVLG